MPALSPTTKFAAPALAALLLACSGGDVPAASETAGEAGCSPGLEGCACYGNQTCNDGLRCDEANDLCVPADAETTSSTGAETASSTDATTSETTAATDTTGAETAGTTTEATATDGTATDGTTTDWTTTAGTTTDGTTSDSGETGDEPFVSLTGYAWLAEMNGLISLGDDLRAVPLSTGEVFVTGTGGLYGKYITVGEGEANETTFNLTGIGAFGAWLDGADGLLQDARMISTTKSPMGTYAHNLGLAIAPNGDILYGGYWWGENYFHLSTPYQSVMKSEWKIEGNQYHRADDPFYTRMDPQGNVKFLRRGLTPGSLTKTWINTPNDVAALPDGDMLISARHGYPGFVVAYGTAGATTMKYESAAHVARLDSDGVPKWVVEHDGSLGRKGLTASPDGVVYSLAYEGIVLFKGTADEMTIPPEADDDDMSWMRAIVRVDPEDGGVLWVRRLVSIGALFQPQLVARDDGGVLATWSGKAEFQVRDEEGVAASLVTEADERVVLSLSPEGDVEWMMSTGLGVSPYSRGLVQIDDELWVPVVVPGDTAEITLGDALVPLPSLDFDTSLSLSLLLRVDAGGSAVEARVLGAGLPNGNMSSDGLSILVAATYHCNMDTPVVFDDMGVGASLPSACDQLDPKAYRGVVMSVPL
ncbi:MAG: hypothetical protein KC486_21845 [Myxococcales bacterium]|nr:hypothetical protein [Myxococcales bacterium]